MVCIPARAAVCICVCSVDFHCIPARAAVCICVCSVDFHTLEQDQSSEAAAEGLDLIRACQVSSSTACRACCDTAISLHTLLHALRSSHCQCSIGAHAPLLCCTLLAFGCYCPCCA